MEAVRVAYDPKEVSYEDLLQVLWKRHDPTQLNRQVGAETPPPILGVSAQCGRRHRCQCGWAAIT